MGAALEQMFRLVIWIIIILTVWGLYTGYVCFFEKKEIISATKITPVIRLVVNDNKVDTLYVYSLNVK